MTIHSCIFCPKAYNRLPPGLMQRPASGSARPQGFPRAAIPVFLGRVSPVLDTCTQLGLLEPGGKQETAFRTIPLKGNSIFERSDEIKKLGVGVVVCGAVSDAFYNLLRERDIDLVCGITGNIEEVIEAYSSGTLRQARFRMPGSD